MTQPDDMADRIADLETRSAHHEQAIQDLSDMTRDQWEVIDVLKRQVARLKDRIGEFEEAGGPGRPENEKPPHY